MQVYALITNAKEAEVERFYEDLQDLLKVTPKKKKKMSFSSWGTGIQKQEEIPGVAGKFGLGAEIKQGKG